MCVEHSDEAISHIHIELDIASNDLIRFRVWLKLEGRGVGSAMTTLDKKSGLGLWLEEVFVLGLWLGSGLGFALG